METISPLIAFLLYVKKSLGFSVLRKPEVKQEISYIGGIPSQVNLSNGKLLDIFAAPSKRSKDYESRIGTPIISANVHNPSPTREADLSVDLIVTQIDLNASVFSSGTYLCGGAETMCMHCNLELGLGVYKSVLNDERFNLIRLPAGANESIVITISSIKACVYFLDIRYRFVSGRKKAEVIQKFNDPIAFYDGEALNQHLTPIMNPENYFKV